MKYKFLTVFVAGVVLSLPPVAEKITQAVENSSVAQQGQDVIVQQDVPADTENKRAIYQQRKEERQAERLDRLDQNRRQALENRCQAAQNILSNVADRAYQSYEKHQTIVERVTDRLDTLYQRLQTNHPDLDLSIFDTTLVDFKAKSTEYLNDFEFYVGAVQESAELENCQDSPKNFHLALETAKDLRKELVTEQQALKQLLRNDVKDAVQTLRQTFVESVQEQNQTPATVDPDEAETNVNDEETQ